jgi:hypothetical protein
MRKFLFLLILLFPVVAFGQITIPASGNWTTSWNCGPSDFIYNSEVYFPAGYCSADGIVGNQGGGAPVGSCTDSTAGSPYWSGVYTAASRAADGTRGDRQWLGPAYTNGMTLYWNPIPVMELRWYERYDPILYAAYEASGALHKDIYINQGAVWAIPEIYGQDYNVALESNGQNNIPNTGNHASIATLMDGNWHYYELHLSSVDGVKMWIDGVQLMNYPSVNPGTTWSSAIFGDNTGDPPASVWGSTCGYVDYDDIAINSTGTYIGPAGSSGGAPTLVSATISAAGTSLVLVFSEPVDYGDGGSVIDLGSGASGIVAQTPISGNDTNTLTYSLINSDTETAATITSGTTVTIPSIGGSSTAWTSTANSTYYLAALTNVSVTNNSTQGAGGPTVTAFVIPSASTSLTIPVTTFTATDPVGVTGFCLNQSSVAPTSASCSGSGWQASAPANYVFATQGYQTLYAWAKDAAGNISTSLSANTTITLPAVVYAPFVH